MDTHLPLPVVPRPRGKRKVGRYRSESAGHHPENWSRIVVELEACYQSICLARRSEAAARTLIRLRFEERSWSEVYAALVGMPLDDFLR